VSVTELALGAVLPLVRTVPRCPEPIALYAAWCDEGRRPDTLLLESADTTAPSGEKSLLVLRSCLRLTGRGNTVEAVALSPNGEPLLAALHDAAVLAGTTRKREGARLRLTFKTTPSGNEEQRLTAPSPVDVVRAVMHALATAPRETVETPLLVGTFGYDLVGTFEVLPEAAADPLDWPDFELWLPDRMLWLDHRREQATIVCFVVGGDDVERRHNDAVAAVAELAGALVTQHYPPRLPTARAAASGPALPEGKEANSEAGLDVSVDMTDAEYAELVARLKTHIVAGDVFQIVPSRTFSLPCANPLAAYTELRRIEATPYMFYLVGERGTLFGASPETAVRVDGTPRTVEIRPIAGTRPRARNADGSIDADLDARLEAELRLDEKEVAEHMMLVDLARNDAARVSLPGSRTVTRLLGVDKHAYVMHLVSHVRGTLRPELDALHAYVATMNMGTLVGAPKVEAARLLRRYEKTRRGPYGGGIGYLTSDGRMDTAIVIRSAVVNDGVAYVRAGAGVVFDSRPEAEAEETRKKAQAVLTAIGRATASKRGAT